MLVGLGDRRQETGDRRQETGDRRQETGDRRQYSPSQLFSPCSLPPTPLSPHLPPATRTKWSPHSPRLFKQDLL
ncbi:hypothetical protein N0824_04104 [Microcystis sp. 0824]|nr:hypothetical protein N0824_04104 [Microcystis sp. 0824]